MTVTATPTSVPSACRDAAKSSSNGNITAVAAGIATPLGVLLIVALIACTLLYRQVRRLKREAVAAHSEMEHAKLGHGGGTTGNGVPSSTSSWWREHAVHLDSSPIHQASTEAEIMEAGRK